MEITLEKIELVKDRTGVSYKEAKEALEKAEGNVVDAIILIEEKVDEEVTGTSETKASAVIDSVKELVKKGNVSKISVKRGEETVLNIPVNVGIIGTVIFPWPALASAIVAFGAKCTIEIVKSDGEVVNVSSKAGEVISVAKSKGGVIVDEVKDKGGDVFDYAKDKGKDVWEAAKDAGSGAWDIAKEKACDALKKVKGDKPASNDFGDLDLSEINYDELEDDNE